MTTPEAAERIDEGTWTARQKTLIALTALAIVFDGIDNQLLGVAIPSIMQEWSVPRSAFAPVVSIGYFGMMLGGAVAGLAGDRFGRRTSLLASMMLFGATTAMTALVSTPSQLALLRLLASAGLGGAIPNAAALAAEYVPTRMRPVAVTLTIVCVPLGGTIAGLLGVRLLPLIGWQMLFAAGGVVPFLYALVLMRALPESPRYVARKWTRWDESIRAVFAREFLRDTLALLGAFFSCLLAVYLGFSWLTSLLTSAGFDPASANVGITAFNLGGVAGALAGSVVIGRLGSRMPMLLMAAAAAATSVVLATMTIDPARGLAVMAMLTMLGVLINGVQVALYALAAHIYPTIVRATGVGAASVVGRTGAIVSGYAGAWAIDYRGSAAYFALIAAAMLLTLVFLACIKRHVRR